MDDLISRKAAIEAMKKWATQPVIMKSRYFDPKGKAIVLDMMGIVKEQPTIPAVPLDKLCAWLETNTRLVRPDGSRWNLDWMKWKEELEKWMEELDAAD